MSEIQSFVFGEPVQGEEFGWRSVDGLYLWPDLAVKDKHIIAIESERVTCSVDNCRRLEPPQEQGQ